MTATPLVRNCPPRTPPLPRRFFFDECVESARRKAEEAERRRKRARDALASLMRHAKGLYSETTWELFQGAFKEEKEFKAVRGGGG